MRVYESECMKCMCVKCVCTGDLRFKWSFLLLCLLVGEKLGDEVLHRDHGLLLVDDARPPQAVDALLGPLWRQTHLRIRQNSFINNKDVYLKITPSGRTRRVTSRTYRKGILTIYRSGSLRFYNHSLYILHLHKELLTPPKGEESL